MRSIARLLLAAVLASAWQLMPPSAEDVAAACSTPSCATLEIVFGQGAGSGLVTTFPLAMDCTWTGAAREGTCVAQYDVGSGLDVTLYLDPGLHSYACYGNDCGGVEQRLTRTVHLNPGDDKDVFPVFNAAQHLGITIRMDGTGTGRVTNSAAGLDCTGTAGLESGDCTGDWYFLPSAPVRAGWTADPATDSFHCVGQICNSPNETVTFDYGSGTGNQMFEVRFFKAVPVTVSIKGSGTVVSDPAGISCPGTCSKWFRPKTGPFGDDPDFTATPAAGWFIKDWGGACDGTTGRTCTVVVGYDGPAISVVFARVATPPPTARPTPRPTAKPTAAPTLAPATVAPTAASASGPPPTAAASVEPGATAAPTTAATAAPTAATTPAPSNAVEPVVDPGGSGGAGRIDPLILLLVAIILMLLLALGFALGRRRRPRGAARGPGGGGVA